MKNINGKVRISLQDYTQLIKDAEESQKQSQRKKEYIEMLGNFLQFLKTKQYFDDIQQEFNGPNNKLKLFVDENDGRAKLKFNG